MYSFLLLFFFIQKTVGFKSVYESELPVQPKYIIVASRQRSSSSTLSNVIGSHPCVLSGNEIWSNSPAQDMIGAHGMVNMTNSEISENPEIFLNEVHEKACKNLPNMCNGKCSIVIKLFDIHGVKGVVNLINDKDFFFVVLEREIRGEYCSHLKAKLYNDWGTTPGAHKSLDFQCDETDSVFIEQHDNWFSFLRNTIRSAGRFFMDIPFSVVASCELRNLVNSIYGATGLSVSAPMELSDQIKVLFENC